MPDHRSERCPLHPEPLGDVDAWGAWLDDHPLVNPADENGPVTCLARGCATYGDIPPGVPMVTRSAEANAARLTGLDEVRTERCPDAEPHVGHERDGNVWCPGVREIPAADPEACGSRYRRIVDDRLAVCGARPGHDGVHTDASRADTVIVWRDDEALAAADPEAPDSLRAQLRQLAAELEDEAARSARAGTPYGEGESVGMRWARRSVLRIADAEQPATPPGRSADEIWAAIEAALPDDLDVPAYALADRVMPVVGQLIAERDTAMCDAYDSATGDLWRHRASDAQTDRDEQRQRAERLDAEWTGMNIHIKELDRELLRLHNELNHAGDELVKTRTERDRLREGNANGQRAMDDLHGELDWLRRKLAVAEHANQDGREALARVRAVLTEHLSVPMPGVPPVSYKLARRALAALDGTDGGA